MNRGLMYSISAFIYALYLGLFLSGFISFASNEQTLKTSFLTLLAYSIYGFGLFLSLLCLTYDDKLRRVLYKVFLFFSLASMPVLFNDYTLDGIEKNHLVAMGSISIFTALAVASGAKTSGRFSASVIVLVSLLCLSDANFIDGFTNTTGRAAALFVNPNIAAMTLLISATGAIWAVPAGWRLSFAILVGGAIFSTLSRNSMLIGTLTAISALPLLKTCPERMTIFGRRSLIAAGVTLLSVLAILTAASVNNHALTVAASDAITGLRLAKSAWEEARSDDQKDSSATISADDASGLPGVEIGQHVATKAAAPSQLVEAVEKTNSAATRAVLLQRAFRAYQSGPPLGLGLAHAFELAPHNSYLFFAVGFGHVGWLIVPALVALILGIAGWHQGLPSAVAISGGAFFSHDVFIALPLVAAITIVLSGLIFGAHVRYEIGQTPGWPRALAATLVAGGIVVALASVADSQAQYRVAVDTSMARHVDGTAYWVPVPQPKPVGLVRANSRDEGPERKDRLGEEVLISGCSASIEDVIRMGQGRCNFEGLTLVFSTPDNESPVGSGMRHIFITSTSLHPLAIIMVVLVLIWAAFWHVIAYRRFLRISDNVRFRRIH